ncbi:MAG: DUF2330 domain-containing protein [Bacteroidota bacterium]
MMRKSVLIALFILAHAIQTFAFCGFYVAKADAKLFNKSSQVIIARDGTQVAITMSSDFEGDVKDFAMVVPVPVVLRKNQIRIAKQSIFDKLDAYSGPRLVEYHDPNPCTPVRMFDMEVAEDFAAAPTTTNSPRFEEKEKKTVTILESYTVGEYDILILSATESKGLESWLIENGYKIPRGASEVLDPYIKSQMNFFVVKVNLENFKKQGFDKLRPIQMSFHSERFMLPIRLGMANANGDQDLIVYSFSRKGRVEATNYRTLEIPTNQEIPLSVQAKFGEFYKALYDKAWKAAGHNAVHVEYAWDLSSKNFVKCDPCPTQPPSYADLREAGVFWATQGNNGRWGGSDYDGDIFMTRLHARYNRQTFPQDLLFQETPNQANFQGRYVMRHPAQGDLTCDQGQNYLQQLHDRRVREVSNLNQLTGWAIASYNGYIEEYDHLMKNDNQPYLGPIPKKKGKGWVLPFGTGGPQFPNWMIWLLPALFTSFSLGLGYYWYRRKRMLHLS